MGKRIVKHRVGRVEKYSKGDKASLIIQIHQYSKGQ